MRTLCIICTLASFLICSFSLQVNAEEQPNNPVQIRGLVVSSRDGLTINDGRRDYLLLGVDNIGIEGRICIIFGDLTNGEGGPTIDVFEIHLVSEDDQLEDTIGFCKDRHILTRAAQCHTGQACQAFPSALACRNCAHLTSELGRNDVPHVLRSNSTWRHIVPFMKTAGRTA